MGRTALLVLAILAAGCSSSTPADDAGLDAQDDVAAASDAPAETGSPCTVPTCSGPVDLQLGQTIPNGDNCGDTCSFKSAGGFTTCGCSYLAGCSCPDAGDQ